MNYKTSVGGGGKFCDLEKAFDFINHRIQMGKLEFCGIVGKFHLLLKSYLCDRFQGVLTDNKIARDKSSHSNWEEVKFRFHKARFLALCFFFLYQ
jgi:hypothetical protein